MPSFALVSGNEKNVAICAPVYFQARHDGWTSLPFSIDKKIIDVIGSKDIYIVHWFSDEDGNSITDNARMKIDVNDLDFLLPVKSPELPERCVFNIRVLLEDKNKAVEVNVKADII
jgi:hypothetical protein